MRERQEGEPFGRDHHPGESEGAGRERREGEIRPGERGTRGERRLGEGETSEMTTGRDSSELVRDRERDESGSENGD